MKRRVTYLVVLAMLLAVGTLLAIAPSMQWLGLFAGQADASDGFDLSFWCIVSAATAFTALLLVAAYFRRKRFFSSCAAALFLIIFATFWTKTYAHWLDFSSHYWRMDTNGKFRVWVVEVIASGGGMSIDYLPQGGTLRLDRQLPRPNPDFWCGYEPGAVGYPALPYPPTVTINKLTFAGFGYSRYWNAVVGKGYPATGVVFPLWWPMFLSALIASWWPIHFWRHRRRYGPGYCQRCGYDLRASTERCPECGAATSIATATRSDAPNK